MRRFLLLVPALLCAACDRSASSDAGPAATPVTVLEVVDRKDAGLERYSADLDPYSLVRVRSQVDGQVVEIPTRPGSGSTPRELQGGDRVESGEALVKIDDSIYAEKVAKAEAELADQVATEVANKDQYDRYVSAGDAVAAGQTENFKAMWESAVTRVARAQHELDIAKINLERCDVVAPQAGLLLNRDIEVGDIASKGALLFELADTSRMKVVFDVPAELAASFQEGTVLGCTIEALDSREYAGPVTRISPAADQRSRLFEVEITVNNADDALKVGMIATLSLPGEIADADAAGAPVLVPIDAIVRPPTKSDGFAVYVLAGATQGAQGTASGDATVELRAVEVGDVLGAEVVVEKGLVPGDRVVVRGSTIVTEGAAVRVLP